jgi:hypothetical protein
MEDVQEWLSVTEWSQQQISEEDVIYVQHRLKDLNLISDKKPYYNFIKENNATF